MTRVFLGFGSNLGCKVGNVRRAVRCLERNERIQNVRLSSFYKTAPIGKLDQDWFVNAVACLDTSLSARELLDVCLSVELELKRVRNERWGPRTLDIDILFYGEESIDEEALQVPHPRISERAFVLEPLVELDPLLTWEGIPMQSLLAKVSEQKVECMREVVAILGASDKEDRYSNMAQRFLSETGHTVVPVAPRGDVILGAPVVRSLLECAEPVDTVTLYIGSARVDSVREDLIQILPKRVIFNPGTENASLRTALESEGIETLEACTLVMLRTGQF